MTGQEKLNGGRGTEVENKSRAGAAGAGSAGFPVQAHANELVMLNCIFYGDNNGIIIMGLKLNYITISITK